MNECIGKTIITTDGTTLLGSDDKAGCAIIIEIAKEILKLPIDNWNNDYELDHCIINNNEYYNFDSKYLLKIKRGKQKMSL